MILNYIQKNQEESKRQKRSYPGGREESFLDLVLLQKCPGSQTIVECARWPKNAFETQFKDY